jgi:hypothetical protein
MKTFSCILFLLLSTSIYSQEKEYSENVNSIDTIIETLYSVISGEKNEARNWELFQYLFHKDAKLIPSGNNRQGVSGARYMTTQEYIATSGKWLLENGFFEKEIGRKTDQFGNIAQVFSSYESFRSAKDTKPFMRGINSIQLLYDGSRWWILNVFWQGETPEQPIPEKYID